MCMWNTPLSFWTHPQNLYFNYKKSILVKMEVVIGCIQIHIAQVIEQDNEWVVCNLVSEYIVCVQFIAIPRQLNSVVLADFIKLVQENF